MRLSTLITCTLIVALAGGVASAESKHPKQQRASVARTAPADPCADPYAVCRAGTYIGRDPDPRIRSQLPLDMGTSND